ASNPIDFREVELRETDRIRRHVESLLPMIRVPEQRRVVVTSFPSASPAGTAPPRRGGDHGVAGPHERLPPAAPRTGLSDAGPRATGGSEATKLVVFTDVMAAVVEGRFDTVPRQVWLSATSVCVGLLAGILWWSAGSRDRRMSGHGRGRHHDEPRIDWSAMTDARDDVSPTTHTGLGRAAVVLVAVLATAAPTFAAEESFGPPGAAIAPLPEPLPAESRGPEASVAEDSRVTALETRVAATPSRHAPLAGAMQTAPDRTGSPMLPAVPLGVDPNSPSAAGGSASSATGRLTDWKLLAVIAAAFAVVAGATVVTKRRSLLLPPDVFEVLGEGTLGGPHTVRIVRFGPKTLLVGVSAGGCQTLAELTDPQATACIAAACRGVQPVRVPPPSRQRARAVEVA
ncbi:MAG: flagellar biosynthetic protein FliO, partial [Planctomycetia bacterium]